MDNRFGRDLTVGSVPRHLLNFSIPMLIGNLLNIGYSIINMIWVGNILGENAVGATAVSFNITFILIGLAAGITMATTILVSQYYGAKDYKMVEEVVGTSFSLSFFIGVSLTIIGICCSDFLLHLMDTPPDVFSLASSYLKISLVGFIFQFFSFLIAAILRGVGDTKTPLVFMSISMVINAALDPLFIMGVGPIPELGLNGAAYASLISTAIAFISSLVYLNRKKHIVAINPSKFKLDRQLSLLILKIGLPSAVQQSLVSIGAAFITTFVNSFGPDAIAAFGAASRIDSIAFLPAMSMSMAVSALTGQNLGAKKPERVKEIFKWGIIMTSAITISISLLAVSTPRLILSMFIHDPSVLDIGVTYLRIVGMGYILFAIMFISNGVINGAGHTITTMVFSLVSLWLVRVPMAALLSRTSLGLKGIWISMLTSFAIIMTVSLLYYFSGRWKKVVIRRSIPIPAPEME